MAFPQTLNPASPANTDSPKFGAAEIRNNKQFLLDVFGFPAAPTAINAPAFSIASSGVVTTAQPGFQFQPGTLGSPGFGFVGSSNTGLATTGPGALDVVVGGVRSAQFGQIANAVNYLHFYPNATGSGPIMQAEGADASVSLAINTKGPSGSLQLWTNGQPRWTVTGTGDLISPIPNSLDIGVGGFAPRDIWVGRDLYVAGTLRVDNGALTGVAQGMIVMANNIPVAWVNGGGVTVAGTGLYLSNTDQMVYQVPTQFNNHAFVFGGAVLTLLVAENSGGGLRFLGKSSADHAANANQVVIYWKDNGSGKGQLMARFPTGAAQQLAIEP